MLQAVLTLAQRVDPAADRGHALADIEIQSLHKCRVDLPATYRQDLFDRFHRAEHYPVLHPDQAHTPVLFDDLRIEQPREEHPAGLGPRAFVLATLRVNPEAKMTQNSRQIALKAIAKPSGHTPWR